MTDFKSAEQQVRQAFDEFCGRKMSDESWAREMHTFGTPLAVSKTAELLKAEATIREQAERIRELQEVIDAAYRGCDCGSDPKSRLIPGHKPTCWMALHLRGKQ